MGYMDQDFFHQLSQEIARKAENHRPGQEQQGIHHHKFFIGHVAHAQKEWGRDA